MTTLQKKTASRSVASKKLIIQEHRRRLKDSIRSLNDNFSLIISAARVTTDDGSNRHAVGRMTEYYTVRNEMAIRAELIVRATEDLLRLTKDLKEFLILHDFSFLSHAMKQTEEECDKNMNQHVNRHYGLRNEMGGLTLDIDKEVAEGFSIRL